MGTFQLLRQLETSGGLARSKQSMGAPQHAEREHESPLLPAAQPSVPALHQNPLHPELILRRILQCPDRLDVPDGHSRIFVSRCCFSAPRGAFFAPPPVPRCAFVLPPVPSRPLLFPLGPFPPHLQPWTFNGRTLCRPWSRFNIWYQEGHLFAVRVGPTRKFKGASRNQFVLEKW